MKPGPPLCSFLQASVSLRDKKILSPPFAKWTKSYFVSAGKHCLLEDHHTQGCRLYKREAGIHADSAFQHADPQGPPLEGNGETPHGESRAASYQSLFRIQNFPYWVWQDSHTCDAHLALLQPEFYRMRQLNLGFKQSWHWIKWYQSQFSQLYHHRSIKYTHTCDQSSTTCHFEASAFLKRFCREGWVGGEGK